MGLELLWRRRTHWCMGLAGGLCSVLLCALFLYVPLSPAAAYFAGAGLITAVELAFGLVCNVKLGMGIWDYSRFRLHFKGQICLVYSLLWGLLGLALWAGTAYL